MEKKVHFGGIVGSIRRGIKGAALDGMISFDAVRNLLPEEKRIVPDKVLETSLTYMVNRGEIEFKDGRYWTNPECILGKGSVHVYNRLVKKQTQLPIPMKTHSGSPSPTTIVVGNLISTKTENGKIIAEIEVVSMEVGK